jgi:hypothetical protein
MSGAAMLDRDRVYDVNVNGTAHVSVGTVHWARHARACRRDADAAGHPGVPAAPRRRASLCLDLQCCLSWTG